LFKRKYARQRMVSAEEVEPFLKEGDHASMAGLTDFLEENGDPRSVLARKAFEGNGFVHEHEYPFSNHIALHDKIREVLGIPSDRNPHILDTHLMHRGTSGDLQMSIYRTDFPHKIGIEWHMPYKALESGHELTSFFTPEEAKDFVQKYYNHLRANKPEVTQELRDEFIGNSDVPSFRQLGTPEALRDARHEYQLHQLSQVATWLKREFPQLRTTKPKQLQRKYARPHPYNQLFVDQLHKTLATPEMQQKIAALTPEQRQAHEASVKQFSNLNHMGILNGAAKGDEDKAHDIATRILMGSGNRGVGDFFRNYDPTNANLNQRFVSFVKGTERLHFLENANRKTDPKFGDPEAIGYKTSTGIPKSGMSKHQFVEELIHGHGPQGISMLEASKIDPNFDRKYGQAVGDLTQQGAIQKAFTEKSKTNGNHPVLIHSDFAHKVSGLNDLEKHKVINYFSRPGPKGKGAIGNFIKDHNLDPLAFRNHLNELIRQGYVEKLGNGAVSSFV